MPAIQQKRTVASTAEIYLDTLKMEQEEKDTEKDATFGVKAASSKPVWAPLVRLQALYKDKSWYFVCVKKRKEKKGNAKSEKKEKYKKLWMTSLARLSQSARYLWGNHWSMTH